MIAFLISLLLVFSNFSLFAGQPGVENPWASVDTILRNQPFTPSIEFYDNVVKAIETAQQLNPTQCMSMNAEKKRINYCLIKDRLIQIYHLNNQPISRENIAQQVSIFAELRRSLPTANVHYAHFERNLIEAYKKQLHLSLWENIPDLDTAKNAITNLLLISRLAEGADYWKQQRQRVSELEKLKTDLSHPHNQQYFYTLRNMYTRLYCYPSEVAQKNKTIAELERIINLEATIETYNRAKINDPYNYARLLALSHCLASQQPTNPLWQCDAGEYSYLALLQDLQNGPLFKDFSNQTERKNILDTVNVLERMNPSNATIVTQYTQIKNATIRKLDRAECLDRLTHSTDVCDTVQYCILVESIERCKTEFGTSATALSLNRRKQWLGQLYNAIIELTSAIKCITEKETILYEESKEVFTLLKIFQKIVKKSSSLPKTQTSVQRLAQPLMPLHTQIQHKQQLLSQLLNHTSSSMTAKKSRSLCELPHAGHP